LVDIYELLVVLSQTKMRSGLNKMQLF